MNIKQRSGYSSELLERSHKSLINLAKIFAPSFRKHPGRLSRPAAFETWVYFKIVINNFAETDSKLEWEPWIISS